MRSHSINVAHATAAVCLSLLASCSQGTPTGVSTDGAEKIAAEFVATYYVENDIEAAARLTVNPARARLDAELADIRATDPARPSDLVEKVHTEMLSVKGVSQDEVTSDWFVKSANDVSLAVRLHLKIEDDAWRVFDIAESPR